jgi:D-alanyl-D-alanine carboxypeptidase-like protein
MPLVTENGWPQCSAQELDRLLVPGTANVKIELREGNPAVILTAWAAWWHRNVRSIVPPDGHRNYWGWSATNDVWNSNHLSGTAIDLCADELPWQRYVMPQEQITIVERGLNLFEGTVYWGGHWGRVDQMHSQIGLPPTSDKIGNFANKLNAGYLNIFGPFDPNMFPLPEGYYYGPLDGPIESISGEYESDSQAAKDGLGRWQAALGLPVSKKWNDGYTPNAAATLQLQKGWEPNPLFGYGGVYEGEWHEVIRDGWRLPAGWKPEPLPDSEYPLTKWGDYSQYQSVYLDDSYPYKVICFRSSIADERATTENRYGGIDQKWLENMKRAKEMVKDGTLKKVIAYHFWVPGYDNFGTFKKAIDQAGGVFPELAFMLDVEDGGDKWGIRNDQTVGVKDFISKATAYFDNAQAASIYLNFRSNANLIVGINDRELRGVKLIVPGYQGPQSEPYTPDGIKYFGHQYSDKEDTPPFGPTDINQVHMPITMFLQAWGINGGVVPPVVVPPKPIEPEVITDISTAIAEQFYA